MNTGTSTPGLATGHIGLNVTELERSVDFYRQALGFDYLGGSADGQHQYAFLGTHDSLQLTLWRQSDGAFSSTSPGLHHLAFEVESIDRVREVEQALKQLGVNFAHDGVVAHNEGSESAGIFFTDPDGIRLEVYAPDGAAGSPAPYGQAPTCGFF